MGWAPDWAPADYDREEGPLSPRGRPPVAAAPRVRASAGIMKPSSARSVGSNAAADTRDHRHQRHIHFIVARSIAFSSVDGKEDDYAKKTEKPARAAQASD